MARRAAAQARLRAGPHDCCLSSANTNRISAHILCFAVSWQANTPSGEASRLHDGRGCANHALHTAQQRLGPLIPCHTAQASTLVHVYGADERTASRRAGMVTRSHAPVHCGLALTPRQVPRIQATYFVDVRQHEDLMKVSLLC